MADTIPVFDPTAAAGMKFTDPAVRAEIAELYPDILAAGSVTESKMANNSVSNRTIAAGAVTEAKIGVGAVGNTHLQAGAVTGAKISAATITPDKMGVGVMTAKDVNGSDIPLKVVYLTAAQYNALVPPDPNTVYLIH
jgi:hypothetical protein